MMRQIFPKLMRSCSFRNSLNHGITAQRFYYRSPRFSPWGQQLSTFENVLGNKMDVVFRNLDRMMGEVVEKPWVNYTYPAYSCLAGKELEIIHSTDKYEVKMDVSNFSPDEISVKLIKNKVEISAKHEEKPDKHGFVSREVKRQFFLPQDVDIDTIVSLLTKDGNLILKGKIKGMEHATERVLNVEKEEDTKQS